MKTFKAEVAAFAVEISQTEVSQARVKTSGGNKIKPRDQPPPSKGKEFHNKDKVDE